MSFANVLNQDLAVKMLQNAIANNRIAHAYLFSGPRGTGKAMAAKEFAKALNCNINKSDPCDRCVSCLKIEADNHPDIHYIEPIKPSKAISIEQVRRLQDEINLKAYEAKFKVFIIEGAQNLREDAQNAFLKTLEEPPADSVIILTSTIAGGLLPTILSRCQQIQFGFINTDVIKDILIKQHGVDTVKAHLLANISEGSLGYAVELKAKDVQSIRDKLIESILSPKTDFFENNFSEEKNKSDIDFLLSILASYFRDLLVLKSSGTSDFVAHIDRIDELRSIKEDFSADDLADIVGMINSCSNQIKQNLNVKLTMHLLMQKVQDKISL